MSGYVYAIGIEATTYVKIGRASSPKARMAAMQGSLPFKLEMLYRERRREPRRGDHGAGQGSSHAR
jgi:hypothetical protein